MKVTQGMTLNEVKERIKRAFQVTEYIVLECDSNGHNLLKCCEQEIDGDAVGQRRGCLYLCQSFQLHVITLYPEYRP